MTVSDASPIAPVRRAATLGRRVGAYLIDGAIAFVVLLMGAGLFAGISFATGGAFPLWIAGVGAYLLLAVWLVVYTLMQGGAGSLGMRATGLRLARADADGSLGFARALGRNIVWGLGGAIVVGYFSPLFDGSPWHRGWHDKASGAVMTDIAGRGIAMAEDASTARLAEQDAGTSPSEASASAASVPSVLPAAPILPTSDDSDLAGWTPAGSSAPTRSSAQASGVISFVPGITDPDLYDAPPPAAPPALPIVEVDLADAVGARAGSGASADSADGVAAADAPVLDAIPDDTRIPTGDRPAARLVWDDGTRQALYGRTVFGRNPAPETGAMVTPVRDETLSLSKTHFELVPDAAGDGGQSALWVVDRHSTNGVVIRRGTQRQSIVPGERTRVHRGDVLEFGDRTVSIEVAP